MEVSNFTDPVQVIGALGVYEGMIVADLGCGVGAYTLPIAEKVGESGRVYAVEVQKDFLINIKTEAAARGLKNIELLWGNIENLGGTKIKDDGVDAVIISNVLFLAEDKKGLLREARRILKTGGKLLLIDWSDSFNNLGPSPEMVVTKDEARALCEAEGFVLKDEVPAGEHHYGFIFLKA
ncbi:MAG: class I SAM-dependent methyltransferase [Candidatus Pacebacteria bacterium]|jgi:ubiquinone/menaquinone biosynthesis C-methylase UbiE|nr:class I SAM-dependent methyltransferase [Candidatus Paceibacterota bacterium]